MKSPPKVVGVIEDDLSMLRGIERLLHAHGVETRGYGSAEAFFASDSLSMLTCVILDIHLAGESGIELRRQIRAAGFDFPAIFITASDDTSLEAEAREAGCIAYLQKPFPCEFLIAAIDQAFVASGYG